MLIRISNIICLRISLKLFQCICSASNPSGVKFQKSISIRDTNLETDKGFSFLLLLFCYFQPSSVKFQKSISIRDTNLEIDKEFSFSLFATLSEAAFGSSHQEQCLNWLYWQVCIYWQDFVELPKPFIYSKCNLLLIYF